MPFVNGLIFSCISKATFKQSRSMDNGCPYFAMSIIYFSNVLSSFCMHTKKEPHFVDSDLPLK